MPCGYPSPTMYTPNFTPGFASMQARFFVRKSMETLPMPLCHQLSRCTIPNRLSTSFGLVRRYGNFPAIVWRCRLFVPEVPIFYKDIYIYIRGWHKRNFFIENIKFIWAICLFPKRRCRRYIYFFDKSEKNICPKVITGL